MEEQLKNLLAHWEEKKALIDNLLKKAGEANNESDMSSYCSASEQIENCIEELKEVIEGRAPEKRDKITWQEVV